MGCKHGIAGPCTQCDMDEVRALYAAALLDAKRYRFMRENIDYTDSEDGSGFYWHNQRGEFSYAYRNDPDGRFRPTFESVIDAAMQRNETEGTE